MALLNIQNQFCWGCEESILLSNQENSLRKLSITKSVKEDGNTLTDSFKPSESVSEPVKERRRKNIMPDISANLDTIMEKVRSNETVFFKATTKSSRGLHNGKSQRRSKYIGVLRNGHRWQVLINVGKKKKYIGTFGDEKAAAIVHDFFSIGLNLNSAKTNFSYDQETIVDMISNFTSNDCLFEPHLFLDRM